MSWEASSRYWLQVIRNFRNESLCNHEEIFSQLKNTLMSTEKELIPTKIHLLTFLQQHYSSLLRSQKQTQTILSLLLNSFVEYPCATVIQVHLIEQIMVTITCLYIQLEDDLLSKPREEQIEEFISSLMEIIRGSFLAAKSFEYDIESTAASLRDFGLSFERGLVEVVGKTGIHIGGLSSKSQERTLRLYAAECLRELEDAFPGILAPLFPEIVALSQYEITHASQSYFSLITTIANNFPSSILSEDNVTSSLSSPTESRSSSDVGIPLKDIPKIVFILPYTSIDNAPKVSIQKEAFTNSEANNNLDISISEKEIGYLFESLFKCTPWSIVDSLSLLLSIVENQNIPILSWCEDFFFRFKCTDFLPIFHQLVCFYLKYSDLFQHHADMLRQRILWFVDSSSSSSLDEKNLVLSWLIEIYPKLFPSLSPIPKPLFLDTFDEICSRGKKTLLLYHIRYWILDSSKEEKNNVITLEYPKPFRYFPSNHFSSSMLQDTLYFIICNIPNLLKDVCEFIRDLLIESPRFSIILLNLLNGSNGKQLPNEPFLQLLRMACQLVQSDYVMDNIESYLDIIEFLLSQSIVDPLPLIILVINMLEQQENFEYGKKWNIDNRILSIVRNIIKIHETNRIHSSLVQLLEYMQRFSADLDVRERSGFILRLLNRVPHNFIQLILSHSELSTLENTLNNIAPIHSVVESNESKNQSKSKIENSGIQFTIKENNEEEFYKERSQLEWVISNDKRIEILQNQNTDSEDIQLPIWNEYWNNIHTSDFTCSYSLPLEINQLESSKDSIFSISIYITPEHKDASGLYFPFPIVHIPVLSPNISHFLSELACKPKKPIPLSLSIQATYQDNTGEFYRENLPPIQIQFKYMIFPLPIQPHSEEDKNEEYFSYFFTKLWNNILEEEEGAESLKVIQKPKKQILETIKKSKILQIIKLPSKNEDKDDETTEIQFIGFLPPHYHILMNFEIESKQTKINMRSDFWAILSHVDPFVNQIFSVESVE